MVSALLLFKPRFERRPLIDRILFIYFVNKYKIKNLKIKFGYKYITLFVNYQEHIFSHWNLNFFKLFMKTEFRCEHQLVIRIVSFKLCDVCDTSQYLKNIAYAENAHFFNFCHSIFAFVWLLILI